MKQPANTLMEGQGPGKWTRAHERYILINLSLFKAGAGTPRPPPPPPLVSARPVNSEAPTRLHLSDCSQGAGASQCPIHKRAEPGRRPTQALCVPTKGHPPTPCCVNDSLAHITEKKRRADCKVYRRWRSESVETKYSAPAKLFITLYCGDSVKIKRGVGVGLKVVSWLLISGRWCTQQGIVLISCGSKGFFLLRREEGKRKSTHTRRPHARQVEVKPQRDKSMTLTHTHTHTHTQIA